MHGSFKLAVMSVMVFGSSSIMAAKAANELPPNMMPCEQVLKLSSSEFIKKYNSVHGNNTLETAKSIFQYSSCYDQYLDQFLDQLTKEGRHPLMGATDHFRDFQQALNNFTATALGLCGPYGSSKRLTEAYAMLYQKQFRNLFYQQYMPKSEELPANAQATNAAKAKLDDILAHLPEKQQDPVKKAFAAYYQTAVTGLKLPQQPVFEYAIMLLQSPADKPYSPPPF